MPRKLSLEPNRINKKLLGLKKKYKLDIVGFANYIYKLCYEDLKFFPIHNPSNPYIFLLMNHEELPLYKIRFKSGRIVPKNINRERAMTYVYILDAKLKQQLNSLSGNKENDFTTNWEDVLFIIYFTLIGGMYFEGEEDFNFELLQFIEAEDASLTNLSFRKDFDFVLKYNFNSGNGQTSLVKEKIKRTLLEKRKSFENKYFFVNKKNSEDFELANLLDHSIRYVGKCKTKQLDLSLNFLILLNFLIMQS